MSAFIHWLAHVVGMVRWEPYVITDGKTSLVFTKCKTCGRVI